MVIRTDGCAHSHRIIPFASRNDGAPGAGIRKRIAAFQNIHAVPDLRHTVIKSAGQDQDLGVEQIDDGAHHKPDILLQELKIPFVLRKGMQTLPIRFLLEHLQILGFKHAGTYQRFQTGLLAERAAASGKWNLIFRNCSSLSLVCALTLQTLKREVRGKDMTDLSKKSIVSPQQPPGHAAAQADAGAVVDAENVLRFRKASTYRVSCME